MGRSDAGGQPLRDGAAAEVAAPTQPQSTVDTISIVDVFLRAARRGKPFWRGAIMRLNTVGMLLLLGIPALTLLQFAGAQGLSSGVASDPFPSPELTVSISQLLPGFLVLALVGIFRRGVELQDLERHTI